jgi:hypothetical protein
MNIYLCVHCGKQFSGRKRSDRIIKFCSITCSASSKKGIPSWNKGIPMKESSKLILSEQRKGKHFSPSTEFKTGDNRGEDNVRWKGGKYITSMGYVNIFKPDHPRSVRGYIAEHILVSEQYLGRYLSDKEVIHHINQVKTDNYPENLYVFSNSSEHMRHHAKLLKNTETNKTTNLF